ncbi:MAG: PAS domain S-box protein, partial [Candidatus Binatia bacterium]
KNQDKTKQELIQDLERAHQRISALEALEDDRKRAEEALRQNEERTRLIVESALDAVITMNTQGLITGWNTQAETIFGWSRGPARHITTHEVPHDKDFAC